jgi:hypothetical protein
MVRLRFAGVLLAGWVVMSAGAADWPQWRGLERNGISPETGCSTPGRDERIPGSSRNARGSDSEDSVSLEHEHDADLLHQEQEI